VDDPILTQDLEIVVDLPDVPVQTVGKVAHTLCRCVHQTPHQFQTTRGEDALDAAGVLEVDDVWHLFTLLPALCTVQGAFLVVRERFRRDAERRGVLDILWGSWAWSGELLLMDGFDLVEEFLDV
jgi:hypothetical protein